MKSNEQPSNNSKQTTNPSLLRQRWAWIGGVAILGAIVGLILFAEFSSRTSSSLQKGWTSYPGAVSALAVDKHGRVWAVCQYNCANNSLRLYQDGIKPVELPIPSELAEPRGMSSLAIDGQDRIWVGSWSGVIGMRDSNNQWKIFNPENFNPENSEPVWDIVVDGQGRAWVRSNEGLGVIDPSKNGTTYTLTNSGLPDNTVNGIAVDEMGQLWVETGDAIKALESDGKWTIIYQGNGCLPGGCPFGSAFAMDHQGQVWYGTSQGVSVLGLNGTWQSYPLGNLKVANEISSIVIDNKDRVWVGARQGLFRFDPSTGWTTYNTGNSPMPDDWVEALAIDGQGRVWIGSSLNGGLSMLDVEAALGPESFQTNSIVWSSFIPIAGLGILLIIGLIIAFTRPGALVAITIREFFIGFLGWFAINVIFWGGFYVIGKLMGPAALVLLFVFWIPPAFSIIAIFVVLHRKRWGGALGVLSAFVMNAIGIILVAPPVTDPYYHFPIFDIVLMIPFFLKSAGL